MPRKPSSVFVIVDQIGQPNGPLTAYREPLDDLNDLDSIVEAHYQQHPAGARIFVVEDTKVDAKDVRVRLEDVDDPRLQDEEDSIG